MIRFTFGLLLVAFPSLLSADINSLTLSSGSVTSCQDYFTSEWATPLDMNNSGIIPDILYDLVPRESQDLSSYSYSGGIFSTSATGVDPYFRILSWTDGGAIADNTTRFGENHLLDYGTYPYSLLTFRMFTDVASDFQVLFDKRDGGWAITNPVTTRTGWQTYQIDLATAGINQSSGNVSFITNPNTGIRIDPNRNNVGAQIKLDWAQLTPTTCSDLTANYNIDAGEFLNLFVDDNTDPTDGFQQRSDPLASTTSSDTWSASLFFPGSYRVYGFTTADYATSYLNTWDMNASDSVLDVDTSRVFNIGNTSFAGNKFCGTTTANDANFYMNLPNGSSIDASKFNKLTVRLELGSAAADQLVVNFFDTNGSLRGSTSVATSGTGTYNINLDGVSGWSGFIGGFRLNPVVFSASSAATFCVDWVTLASSFQGAEPTTTLVDATPATVTFSKRGSLTFVQPDDEGGEDYFTVVKGNPSNFNTNEFEHFSGVSTGTIYPGNSYTDSGGATRIGDYFEGVNITGDGDPQNFSNFLNSAQSIDPEKYKITCFTMDVLAPVTIYHSVLRILWQLNSANIDGDDIVTSTTRERRYCNRMDTLKLDTPVTGAHPWRRNDDGSGLNFFRIDPHEEEAATSYRFADIRLATDHKADTQFAIVVNSDRDMAVGVYYNTSASTSGGTLISTLGVNRNTDVVLWDTSALSNGTYYIYATIGTNAFLAPGRVVVDHTTAQDSTAPVVGIDAPLAGHRFASSLEIGGHALDNLRVATAQAFLDNVLIGTLQPSAFRKSVRDTYSTYPFASEAGFHQQIDVSGYSDGDHTFRLDVYDTAGNKTTHEVTVTKTNTNLTPALSYEVPNEAPIAVTIPTPTPVPGAGLSLTVKPGAGSVKFKIGSANECTTVRLLGAQGKLTSVSEVLAANPVTLLSTNQKLTATINGTSSKVKHFLAASKTAGKKKKKVNTMMTFAVDCGLGTGKVKTLDAKKIKASKIGGSKKLAPILTSIRKSFKRK